jgi:hypothetical protein
MVPRRPLKKSKLLLRLENKPRPKQQKKTSARPRAAHPKNHVKNARKRQQRKPRKVVNTKQVRAKLFMQNEQKPEHFIILESSNV